MERPSVPVYGGAGIRLPVGYRFRPTDQELLLHYLKNRVFGLPLPASVIPDFDVFRIHPSSFPGNLNEKRYFFCKKTRNFDGNNCRRAVGFGCWKSIGKDKQILRPENNQVVGVKKTLVFRGRPCSPPQGIKTRWLMHEYGLVGNSSQMLEMGMEDWVVYCVFLKRRRPRKHLVNAQPSNLKEISSSLVDFMVEDGHDDIGPPQPSSPCSSGITEVSSNGLELEDSSKYTSVSSFSYLRES